MEIIDDLQRDGLVIVRSDSRFAYGHDAVLLTDFVRAHAGERYLDIGTGTGILAILTHAKPARISLRRTLTANACAWLNGAWS